MQDPADLYPDHLKTVIERYERAISDAGHDGILIAAGEPPGVFLDDQHYPFRSNPHFVSWLPEDRLPSSYLHFVPGSKPRLYYFQPVDYWHKPPAPPSGYWTAHFDIEPIQSLQDAANLLGDLRGTAWIGEDTAAATSLGMTAINPPDVLASVHFDRAGETDYEIACLANANRIGARGHLEARAAFMEGESEFDIQVRYLRAIGARESETPYSSIIALNENCAVLHYQHYEITPPPRHLSFLIDAGASYAGYGSDITRTWAAEAGPFADLVARMDEEQQALIGDIEPGLNYADLHERMHYRLAAVLRDANLVAADPADMVETNLTFSFLPHGLGHLLGIQTHDVGGFQQDRSGASRPAPEQYPALRLTRDIEPGQVFTIEPGLYFIPMLLEELRQHPLAAQVNFELIESLLPYGGIRIEDNVLVTEDGTVNLTRNAFAELSS